MRRMSTCVMRSGMTLLLIASAAPAYCWGFYAHRLINYTAVFLLPPEMLVWYKPNIAYLRDHSIDPDKRRYAVTGEAARHYIDLDRYGPMRGALPPRHWNEAVKVYGEDSLQARGIVPWWVSAMLQRLTTAFREKDGARILRISAEIGHYVGDAHVPLHASSNHNGQLTGQHGIHGLWESRIPELLAEEEWDFFIGSAGYLRSPSDFIWNRVLESSAAADTVLRLERELTASFPGAQKFAFEDRSGTVVRQYSSAFVRAYDLKLGRMVEARFRASVFATASFWYTAWVNAGQPDLHALQLKKPTAEEQQELDELDAAWRAGITKEKTCE